MMHETPAQYTQRILGHVQGQQPLTILAATPKRLGRLVKGVTPARLRKRPALDKWSVAEILAHLADVEIVVGWRMRRSWARPEPKSKPTTRTPGMNLCTTTSAIRAKISFSYASCARLI